MTRKEIAVVASSGAAGGLAYSTGWGSVGVVTGGTGFAVGVIPMILIGTVGALGLYSLTKIRSSREERDSAFWERYDRRKVLRSL